MNHEHTEAALSLQRAFAAVCDTLAIDSGSQLTDAQRGAFDVVLPNVYYSALLNAATERVVQRGEDALLFIASDVHVDAPEALVTRARHALSQSDIAVYAPCCRGTDHMQMRPHGSGRLRDVPFVDGFCFAARAELLARLCPVDVEANRLGWGLDAHLGYLALAHGQRCVVDDAVEVQHRRGSGYSREHARGEYRRYQRSQPGLRRFLLLVDGLQAKRWQWSMRLLSALVRLRVRGSAADT